MSTPLHKSTKLPKLIILFIEKHFCNDQLSEPHLIISLRLTRCRDKIKKVLLMLISFNQYYLAVTLTAFTNITRPLR